MKSCGEESVSIAQGEARKKQLRAKRQWEADEMTLFEKALRAKEGAMKRDAIDALGPVVDKIVSAQGRPCSAKAALRYRRSSATSAPSQAGELKA